MTQSDKIQPKKPRYSVCMINLNMEDTIYRAVASVASQLDDDYEVVVLDGGSHDRSLEELARLAKDFKIVRYKSLPRDRSRRMGLERNLSIQEAIGEYVLLHLDCDDIYAPFIKDWVKAFHEIEACMQKDCLVAGKHINMVKREFILSIGGYRNIDFEDRDLWMRCASMDRFVQFRHQDFCTRIPKRGKDLWSKRLVETYQGTLEDIQQGLGFFGSLKARYKEIRVDRSYTSILKFVYIFPAYIHSLFRAPLNTEHAFDPAKFSTFLKKHSKSLDEILTEHGRKVAPVYSSEEARLIFHA